MKRPPIGQRPSLEELAAATRGVAGHDPWACPNCGCKDWRGQGNTEVETVRHSKHDPTTKRWRICRHCGQSRLMTAEVYVPEGHKVLIVPDLPAELACINPSHAAER